MEFLTACGTSILSTIVPDLVKSTGRQVGYIFRFKSIIEDLKEEAENLRLAQENMQHRVDEALKDTDEIEKDVEKWLLDVTAVVAGAEELEEQTREKKTCLNGLCPNLIWRYQMARRAQKKKSIMSKLKDDGKFENISHRTTLSGINVFTQKDFMSSESTTYAINLIIEALKDDKTNVVGLYGMGGVGKTTLAKAVVNKAKEEKIFNEVVMVVVSNRNINEDEDIRSAKIRDIQGQLADFLNLKLQEESNKGRAERLFMRLKNGKKILIILDDIWKKIELADIGIPVDKDCKIFLTTRQEQVCIDMGCLPKIPLNVLNEEEGLVLFKRHSGLNDDQSPKIELAKEVVKECKGLPLAIVAIGSALKEKAINEWKIVTQKLKKSKLMDVDIVDQKLYACLQLSYDYLNNEKTKSCFLLCSLFPEDHEIDMEQLVRYGPGFGLYQNTDSIEDARSELHVMVNHLKASSLLLDAEEGHVKMHDVVRDVALWITSKGKEVFMVKAGMGLTEWPKHEGLEQCTAISLLGNAIEVLPDGLVCPKLKILLLTGNYIVEVSDEFFEEMKTLKVASLSRVHLSLNSLQSLTNLVTLQLIHCELTDISSIKKLAQLEILRLKGSGIVELPKELEELSKLRMLDITGCYNLERIPANVIQRLSQLEELYIGEDSFTTWEVEGRSAEQSNASLSELSQLYYLTILSLRINVLPCLPKEFVLPTKLLRYHISVNDDYDVESYPKSSTLRIRDIEATSLVAFKALYEKVEYLDLMSIKGCCYHNMVPSVDSTGLNELKRLSIRSFDELECIIDTTQQQDVPSTAFSNLVDLFLYECYGLREICSGGRPPRGFLENLETLDIRYCESMSNSLFPSWVLIQGLRKLKNVTVWRCGELEDVFQLEGLCYAKENPFLLSSLESLDLWSLQNLRYIWKGPTQHVSLQSLTVVEVISCDKLRYLFTLSLARSLLQLEHLTVTNCDSLEHIVEIKEAEENVGGGGGNDNMFPKLRKLQLDWLENFISFFDSENYSSTWPAPQELSLSLPRNSTTSFVAQLEANVLQTSKEQQDVPSTAFSNLVDLSLRSCNGLREICSGGRPPRGFLENLETLDICYCKSMSNSLFPSWVLIQGLRKLKKVNVARCGELEDVFQLEGLSYAKENPFLLSSLKSLDLDYLPNLRYIWKGPTQQVSLQSLTVVQVEICNKLRYLFTLSLARSLLQLEELTVRYCDSLEHIVSIKEVEENVAVGGGNDVMFPKLRKLRLDGLENFINFFDSENYSSTWPALQELCLYLPLNSTTSFVAQLEANVLQTSKEKLRVLEVGIMSDQLCNSVLAQLIHGFQNLEELTIMKCRVQGLSQLELSLPSLKVLELKCLEELECLYKGPMHLLSLPNLKKLKVWSCNRLRHMFSPSLARNLLQLEELSIEYCGELEQIFNEDDAEYNQTLLKDHLRWPLLFPNLSSINIWRCDKLKSLFPVSMTHLFSPQNLKNLGVYGCNKLRHMFSTNLARNLLQLEELSIKECGELEQIFNEDDAVDMTSHRKKVLPQLQELNLQALASLINFCPVGYHFIFPSLSKLMVTKCLKLTTRFSVDQNRSVHAEAEAPQTGKEDVDLEQSHPKTTGEIICWSFDGLQKKLPPYIGK